MPTSSLTTAYLSLGSNLGDRHENLTGAIDAISKLAGTTVVRQSEIYESKAWGNTDQPDFLNAVVEISTRLEPHALLRHLQHIEESLGRDRSGEERWGPREIDIDVLLYGDRTLRTPSLQVPHPRMWERHFVLRPLMDLAPHLVAPGGATIAQHVATQKIQEQALLPFRSERPEEDGASG